MSFRSCLAFKISNSTTKITVCGLAKHPLRSAKRIFNDDSETETSLFRLLCVHPNSGLLLLKESGYATVPSQTEHKH